MNTTLANVECPRCLGNGIIVAFRHIDNGRCFLCTGAGSLDVRTADAWKAANVRPDTRHPGKQVELDGFGVATIRPDGQSETGARRFVLSTMSDVGELRTHFAVRGGRVFVESVCAGHEALFTGPGPRCGLGDGWILASDEYRTAVAAARRTIRSVLQAALRG